MRQQSFLDPDGDVRDQIRLYLEKYGISYTKIASEINSSPSHVQRMLTRQRPIKKEYIDRINEFLNTKFQLPTDELNEPEQKADE